MLENDSVGHAKPLTRFIQNNSHSPEERASCPHPVGYFKGVCQTQANQLSVVAGNLPCKRWGCPVCGPKRAYHVRWRILNGAICQEAMQAGFRSSHNVKMLTLTCPGKEYREAYTPSQVYDQMSSSWDKLIRCLKRRHGEFKYFKVYEPQRDGYPHFHAVLVGEGISHRGILAEVEELWRGTYGLGFVKMNEVKSVEHSIRYLTKYLMKCPQSVKRYSRIFSSSRGALVPAEPPRVWVHSRVWIGEARGVDGVAVVSEHEIDLDHLEGSRGRLSFADYASYIDKAYLGVGGA